MASPRVVIDLNSVDEDGETVVLLSDVTGGTLKKGFMVQAIEPEDNLCAPARVASIREDLGIAFLQVDWRAVRRDDHAGQHFGLDKRGWTTSRVQKARSRITATQGSARKVSLRSAQNATY